MNYKAATLETIGGGAALDLFQEEFRRVLGNINDLSVPAETERSITLKFTIKPTKDRGTAAILISATSKMAAIEPHGSHIFIGHEGNQLRAYAAPVQGGLFNEKAQTQSIDEQQK